MNFNKLLVKIFSQYRLQCKLKITEEIAIQNLLEYAYKTGFQQSLISTVEDNDLTLENYWQQFKDKIDEK